MTSQNPAQIADLSPADERVQPCRPLQGEVKRGGADRDDAKVYRVMVRNHDAQADECIVQFPSRTQAFAEAQTLSSLGNTAWVVERYR